MGKPPPRGFWSRLRRVFRRIRIAGWLLVFTLIAALLYLNQVGLPNFVKHPLLEELRTRGVDLQFENLRLSWYRGFVAYDVRFGRTLDPTAPRLTAERVQLSLNSSKLWYLDFEIGGLILHNGRLAWPADGTNDLALEKINAELRLLPGDEWQLDNLEAQLAGARIRLTGSLTNASALRSWKILQRRKSGTPKSPEEKLEQIRRAANALSQLKFRRPPVIRVDFSGDARGTAPFRVGIRSQLGDGGMVAQAVVNPTTREVTFVARSDFDLQRIRPLFTPKADAWLGRFAWDKPPQIRVLGSMILPSATNGPPDWRHEVLPTLKLDGEFKVGRATFREVSVQSARSRLLYVEQTWQLPDLEVRRPEGVLHVAHWTHEPTRDYYWHLRGPFDVKAIRPLLEPPVQRGLDLAAYTVAPQLDVEMWSRWYERERTGVKGHILLSNVTFRGESASRIETDLEYTNLWLHLSKPSVARGAEETASLDSVDVDFQGKMLYLTNGISTLDPGAVTRAIGQKTARAIEPYQFIKPPTARIEGAVSVANPRIADLHLKIAGGPFHWWKFKVPYVAGEITWSNHLLILTNVSADFYDGSMTGAAGFDFSPPVGDDFHFALQVTNASLAKLMPDLGSSTNKLEGNVGGRLLVSWANTRDFQSWQGFGDLTLRNGQLWEIPVFGLFAPVLDVLYPNLGSGRASDGSATYIITNSVIYTDRLELRSPTMRIQYRGSVDFEGHLNARAEAEILRNTALIGPVVSTVLWPVTKLLEYKIVGTLSKPVAEPVYIPKMFLFPFHPIQSLKSIFSDDGKTNAVPKPAGPATPPQEEQPK